MRIFAFVVSLLATVALVYSLNRQWGAVPPVGKFLSPQQGFWQNADALDQGFNAELKFSGLRDSATVYFDDRLVPHVTAKNEEDAYFIQGYLHAKFRLWQMEFQVFAAAGRLSEILGPGKDHVYLNHDREMRRLGMGYGAEKALAEIEKDATTKIDCDAYTAGVNSYISQLKESELPLEYKLLNYQPELWNNLKIALFLKNMSYDLAGGDDDFEMTNAKMVFSKDDFARLYPSVMDSLDPIIPRGTAFAPASIILKTPSDADSLYFNNKDSVTVREFKPEKDNGSNNWVVSGKKTASGRPILCNDPHLGTNMPAIWYEMQLQTNEFNDYGVSFPGAPYIIIGFNDSCAWGVTNAGRDVRDYYEIRFKNADEKEYWYNGQWTATTSRIEAISIKGQPVFNDTVAYTVFGPVMYDPSYTGSSNKPSSKYYAVHWKANDPSNELAMFTHIRSAKNYNDYLEAIRFLHNPGQNVIFASKGGDIAIWQQGEFPAKWKQQGEFVMPGTDSSWFWQGNIPQAENPHLLNPDRGFLSSANQTPADSSYPYWLGNKFPIYRGIAINRALQKMNSITLDDMKNLQTNNKDVFAEMAKPLLLANINDSLLDEPGRNFLDSFKTWNTINDPDAIGPVIFSLGWTNLAKAVWDDEFSRIGLPILTPYESTLLEALLKDPGFSFVDNIKTPEKESLRDIVTLAFRRSVPDLRELEEKDRLTWAVYKDTWARHLLRIPALSRMHLPIGGGTHCINAAKQFHGPSWRMVVQLTDTTEAYGIYPGGQSGNPGSFYYDSFINNWAAGHYYKLWFMKPGENTDLRAKWKINFSAN